MPYSPAMSGLAGAVCVAATGAWYVLRRKFRSEARIMLHMGLYLAAAPHPTLAFMFWGEGLFVFPVMLMYTAISLSVFRGKLAPSLYHY
jgi:cytochrome bd-type quinol oxidase subunit 2